MSPSRRSFRLWFRSSAWPWTVVEEDATVPVEEQRLMQVTKMVVHHTPQDTSIQHYTSIRDHQRYDWDIVPSF